MIRVIQPVPTETTVGLDLDSQVEELASFVKLEKLRFPSVETFASLLFPIIGSQTLPYSHAVSEIGVIGDYMDSLRLFTEADYIRIDSNYDLTLKPKGRNLLETEDLSCDSPTLLLAKYANSKNAKDICGATQTSQMMTFLYLATHDGITSFDLLENIAYGSGDLDKDAVIRGNNQVRAHLDLYRKRFNLIEWGDQIKEGCVRKRKYHLTGEGKMTYDSLQKRMSLLQTGNESLPEWNI